jgi:cytochrome P450
LHTAALPFTEAVVREGLRLHPPLWLLARAARRDTTLGPWSVRAGQRVVFSPYLVQRDARWWDDPDRFRPQRWTGARDGASPWFPFGGGPRVCLGLQVALYELTIATAWLVRGVALDVVDPPSTPRPRPHLRPSGFVARLRMTSEGS